ncbi:hypothetical protein STCU_09129 [Strigomonas culicis]|uniref:Uncharacterized protein n=1 Tax=Strigomonas culicis TaxID=28005 RepID=S9TPF7_9TRYP|nr:hypothetical protein STCU_09129 [Strigomonas culicis]|eukprot:EPY20157.1 hypothetical protein STCU_09129 [Strigomonas culicis]
MHEGVYDPEDPLDPSDEWKAEHAALQAVLQQPVAGCRFTLQAFWQHTWRREALETAHVLEEPHLRQVAAAARARLLREHDGDLAAVLRELQSAIAKGQLDLRAATFKPYFNPTLAKWQYAKYGGSAVVHHMHTARRQLWYHHLATPQEVSATANLYYATKPRSSQIDYTSPYTHRQSTLALCAAYGLDRMYATQQPTLTSAARLAEAEAQIGAVVRAVAEPMGRRRRARQAAARAANQRLLQPITHVRVTAPPVELLPTGAPDSAITQSPAEAAAAVEAPLRMWPLGSRQAVHYAWATPQLDRLRRATQAGPLTAARLQELEQLTSPAQCRLELSLWRRARPEERAAARAAAAATAQQLQALVAASPELAEVRQYATHTLELLAPEGAGAAAAAEAEADDEWVFAVMLDDAARLRVEQVTEVYLPYQDAAGRPLPQGEYRVRVRAFDRESALAAGASAATAAAGDPALCAEAFSEPFPVFDALPQLLDQFFKDGKGKEEELLVDGADLVPLCARLREAGLDVPLMLEFDVGQALNAKGQFALSRLLALLRGTTHHRSLADSHLTAQQHELEPHCRAHWGLYHPGASDGEWAEARRAVLDHAMDRERDWWLPDPLLDVKDLATGSTNSPAADFAYLPSTDRYGATLCRVLSAEGSASAAGGDAPPGYLQPQRPAAVAAPVALHADATVDGSGALRDLAFYGAAATAADLSIDTALAVAQSAVAAAQARHSTLSMFKLGPVEKQAQVMLWCGARSLPFGGKYARTYVYAAEQAKAQLAAEAATGVATRRFEDAEVERRSDQTETDRFASATHPELRRKQFSRTMTVSGTSNEDPTPDQTSTWGQ